MKYYCYNCHDVIDEEQQHLHKRDGFPICPSCGNYLSTWICEHCEQNEPTKWYRNIGLPQMLCDKCYKEETDDSVST